MQKKYLFPIPIHYFSYQLRTILALLTHYSYTFRDVSLANIEKKTLSSFPQATRPLRDHCSTSMG
jgi:hypothetical protein